MKAFINGRSIYNKTIMRFKFMCIIVLFVFTNACKTESKSERAAALYQGHCARCHIAPNIEHLPKDLWLNSILPEMAARMGIKDGNFQRYAKMDFEEMQIIHKSGIYPFRPSLSEADWTLLKEYILEIAPDSLEAIVHNETLTEQTLFEPTMFPIDETPGSYFTFLRYNKERNAFRAGDISGNLLEYSFKNGKTTLLHSSKNAIVDYHEKDTIAYLTDIGILNPSELSSGKILAFHGQTDLIISDSLHRPVNNLVVDLNNDGIDEMVVSEFGHLTGQLSLLVKTQEGYDKKTLLSQPGTILAIDRDLNKDGKTDIAALTSQGDESITFLYQEDNLTFRTEKVIRFSPIYGSSWFELFDYDGDGDDDLITVNGDNADKTYIHKSYHGLRIHLNDGDNNFTEAFFYPLDGATRFVSNDFDQDGDHDFMIISTFPDYNNNPEYSVVYLENIDKNAYSFKTHSIAQANDSRWFLLDTGDVDQDGDTDIIFSGFTYVFTPVPTEITEIWNSNDVDIMILENKLINKD